MANFTDLLFNTGVFSALIAGVCVVFYVFFSRKSTKDEDTQCTILSKTKKENSNGKRNKNSKEQAVQKSRKRTNDSRWTRREKPQQFSHPWHLTTFKGHTGNVLDLEFSSNGKFLATCSDEDPDSVSTEESGENSTSSSEGNNKENSSSASDNSSPRKGLSRRQKKNRRSVDSSPPEQQMPKIENPKPKQQRTPEKKITTKNNNINNNNSHQTMPTLREFEKFELSESDFYALLHEHVILPEQMFTLGFPEEVNNKVRILKQHFWKNKKKTSSLSSSSYTDSDQTSTSSSDGLEEVETAIMKENDSNNELVTVVPRNYGPRPRASKPKEARSRSCSRCNTEFFTTSTEYLTQARCTYHWGKLRYTPQVEYRNNVGVYSCCNKSGSSTGCSVARYHVWNGLDVGINDSLKGFVKTRPGKMKNNSYGIYALDCEMCFTVKGLELCKVTVVGIDGRVVYNHFVRPEYEVIDYNTRFSGVDERDLSGDKVKSLKEVQRDLLSFINDKTILIGHALENDLRALKLVHSRIADTSLSYPHDRGYPYKYSLKQLASQILQKEIQTSELGHDSYEDAASCMELMKFRIQCTLNRMRCEENNNNNVQQHARHHHHHHHNQQQVQHHNNYSFPEAAATRMPRMPRTFP